MKKHAPDYWILIFAIGLSAFGILMILSASYYSTMNSASGPYYYAAKQLRSALVGIVVMIIAWKTNYTVLRKFSKIFYGVAVVLLALVLVIGTNVNGATRWIYIGGFSLQPSDIAKFALVLILADIFAKDPNRIHKFSFIVVAAVLTIGLAVLIMLQPNMSTTVCIVGIAVAMLFASGLHWGYLAAAGGAGVLLGVVLILAAPYRIKRLQAFLDPWQDPLGSGYQLIQSLYALGSGGLFGVGIGQSRQKYLYMPFGESDFIFAIIAEEIGFIGCLLLFTAFAIFIWRGILVALRTKNPFGCLLSTGIVSMIAIQTIINFAVVTGSIPPTGLPLPFISYGGTSLIIMLASVGVLLNISQYTDLPVQTHAITPKYGKHSIWKKQSQ